MVRTLALCIILAVWAVPGRPSEGFKDVPKDHWAAESVNKLADAGVVQGYPDATFRGDKPVTRYEFAVALERFIYFVEQSREPLVTSSVQTHWGDKSMQFLKSGGFLPADSVVLKDGDKAVTFDDMAHAFASVAARLVELEVPPPDDN